MSGHTCHLQLPQVFLLDEQPGLRALCEVSAASRETAIDRYAIGQHFPRHPPQAAKNGLIGDPIEASSPPHTMPLCSSSTARRRIASGRDGFAALSCTAIVSPSFFARAVLPRAKSDRKARASIATSQAIVAINRSVRTRRAFDGSARPACGSCRASPPSSAAGCPILANGS